ncbi:hypothetical protein CWS35_08690 [Bradyrhizobium sp. SK17]|nr:hypothetical protein CWS35_08690 [Bradyrhizobium sp. SK17]
MRAIVVMAEPERLIHRYVLQRGAGALQLGRQIGGLIGGEIALDALPARRRFVIVVSLREHRDRERDVVLLQPRRDLGQFGVGEQQQVLRQQFDHLHVVHELRPGRLLRKEQRVPAAVRFRILVAAHVKPDLRRHAARWRLRPCLWADGGG